MSGTQSWSGGATVADDPGDDAAQTVLRVVGEVDLAAAAGLRRQLAEQLRDRGDSPVVVDMSGVSFIDCAGLQPLLSAQKWLASRHRSLVVRPASASVRRLLSTLSGDGDLLLAVEGPAVEGPALKEPPSEAAGPDRLGSALRSRAVVDGAKGLLMDLHECDADGADRLLKRVAARHGVTVRDIAAVLVKIAAANSSGAAAPADAEVEPALSAAVAAALGSRAATKPPSLSR